MLRIPQCMKCVHFHKQIEQGVYRCDAFEVIPDEIFFNEVSHKEPYPGDQDIRYEEEPKPGESPRI